MSIAGINGHANWWQWRHSTSQNAAPGSSGAARPATASGSAAESPAASGSMTSFLQALSADLQAMLTRTGSRTTGSAPSSPQSATAPDDSTARVAAHSAAKVMQQHRRHHPLDGSSETVLRAGAGKQSASVLAADLTQALQSYRATAPAAAGTSVLV